MLRPTDTFWLYPDGEDRPGLEFRAQSAGYWIDYQRKYADLQTKRPGDFYQQILAMASEGLVTERDLSATCTLADIEYIVMRKPGAALLSDWDKKKSLLSPPSPQDSAGNAASVQIEVLSA